MAPAIADTVTATTPKSIRRLYPHVDGLTDPSTQQTVRLLWDRVHSLEERLQTTEAGVTDLISVVNQHADIIEKLGRRITELATRREGAPAATDRTPPPPGPPPPAAGPPTNHLAIVNQAILDVGIVPTSTNEQLFLFAKTVAWRISQLGDDPVAGAVGLLAQGGGDGTFTCNGTTYAVFRICYSNGANIKILTGSFTGQWSQEADVPVTDWRAPVDPATPCL